MWYEKIKNIEFEDIDHSDAPDYADAHIVDATIDGRHLTEEELEEVNDDADFMYEQLQDHIVGYYEHLRDLAEDR